MAPTASSDSRILDSFRGRSLSPVAVGTAGPQSRPRGRVSSGSAAALRARTPPFNGCGSDCADTEECSPPLAPRRRLLAEAAEEAVQAALGEGILRPLPALATDDSDPETLFGFRLGASAGDALLRAAMGHLRPPGTGTGELQAYCTDSVHQATVYRAVRATLGTPVEQLLWHGTSWQSLGNILRSGFNRAFSGRHGSRFGVGTYFATNPDYALRFCDNQWPKALLLARVVVGKYTRGYPSMKEPPLLEASSGSARQRYDSTVDDPERPNVFCIFRDFQALPVGLVVMG